MSIHILSSCLKHEKFNFPVGEKHVRLIMEKGFDYDASLDIEWRFECNEEIVELMLLCDAIHNTNPKLKLGFLSLPYVPFSRQDRVTQDGECFSLKVFCNLINSIGFDAVYIDDPHSDVTPALLNKVYVRKQHNIFLDKLSRFNMHYLISCDAGANKKIYELAKYSRSNLLGVIECSKIRNTTDGKIVGVKVHADDLHQHTCVIVDDICDGGRSFIEVAKILKDKNAGKIILMVTHGFFTHPKGVHVFDGLIDEIYTRDGLVDTSRGA